MAQTSSPLILQIVREPVNAGSEAAYKEVEDEIARACATLKCPHPHLALESLTGPREVWWFNAYGSDEERLRVEQAYAANRALIASLERLSARKRRFTAEPITVYGRHRPELSRGGWTPAGARFVVVVMRQDGAAEGTAVFEGPDGLRFTLEPAATRPQAESVAFRLGQDARVFAVRPYWGLPAKDWIDADPEFWKVNPLLRR